MTFNYVVIFILITIFFLCINMCIGTKGGVELAFMSASTSLGIAQEFSEGNLIFNIDEGAVDKGADVSWLSQYPNEKEIVFSPLTSLEVVDDRLEILKVVRGRVAKSLEEDSEDKVASFRVIYMRTNINLKTQSFEEFLDQSKLMVLDTIHFFINDLRYSSEFKVDEGFQNNW